MARVGSTYELSAVRMEFVGAYDRHWQLPVMVLWLLTSQVTDFDSSRHLLAQELATASYRMGILKFILLLLFYFLSNLTTRHKQEKVFI